ncbi:MAG TPA: ATP-dependent helicase HrpB [Stellaceae bacterium]|nr:ATP-dependent helicase HrpB [Stellaceae bacterium]
MGSGLDRWRASLPVAELLPDLSAALSRRGAAVLEAPPGAGKTTLVPLALLDAEWLGGSRILMLEPRRLAARAAARRMADMLEESVGETVGYRTRLDTRVGPKTRIEVLTEGILLRALEQDAALEGTGLVIFDEFHERSLDADLGLALALDVRRHLREDLRLLVMSATLDGAPVARMMGDAPILACEGRAFEVALRYLSRPTGADLERAVVAAVKEALGETRDSILVFLPGGGEIRRVERSLRHAALGEGIDLAPLYGDLPQQAQDAAIRPPPPGRRKIVLATSIAETSLTIEGVGAVIDCGLMRVPRYEPASGMTRLETVRVSQAASEQRRGRAGRLGPGLCYRLWREAEQAQLAPYNTPEIRDTDLAPLALSLALWGSGDPGALQWLDPPPEAAYAEARALLRRLGALGADGTITAHGRAMAAFGLPPRLAHMILRGKEWGMGALACALAALLVERDPVKAGPGVSDADIRLRVELLRDRAAAGGLPAGFAADHGALERTRDAARQYRRRAGVASEGEWGDEAVGRLVAQAYPDRIAQRRTGAAGQFRLAQGRGAMLPTSDPLSAEDFLAVAHLDGERRTSRIFLAAPLSRAAIEADFADALESVDSIAWDGRTEAVLSQRRLSMGALDLKIEPLIDPPPERVAAAVITGIRSLGLDVLPWAGAALSLRRRIDFLRRIELGWPDLSDAALMDGLEAWLAPFLGGITRRTQFENIDLVGAIAGLLQHDQRRALDRRAPTHMRVPSGSSIAIDYNAGDVPVLAVRLQEMFGARSSPAIADGEVPLLLHLLSPAGRPLQLTRDLDSFWRQSYPEVRREMRGRYPRHPWPENPLDAVPTRRANPKVRA